MPPFFCFTLLLSNTESKEYLLINRLILPRGNIGVKVEYFYFFMLFGG